MAERETGKVKWFNDARGYGFIERPDGGDVFVHFSSVRGTGFKKLAEGQRVDYVVTQGAKGLQAQDVGPAADEIEQRVKEIGAARTATAVADSANASKPEGEEPEAGVAIGVRRIEVEDPMAGEEPAVPEATETEEEELEFAEVPDVSTNEEEESALTVEPDASDETNGKEERPDVVEALAPSEADQSGADAIGATDIREPEKEQTILAGAEAQSDDETLPRKREEV